MRIDLYLSSTNICKRRSIAADMCDHKAVLINDKVVKRSSEVKIGDVITLSFLESKKKFIVLDLPKTKSVPKSQSQLYVKLLDSYLDF